MGPIFTHRTKIGEHPQDVRRRLEHARRQRMEPVEPCAPRRRRRPAGHLLDDRQRERFQVRELLLNLPEAGNPGFVAAVITLRFADLPLELGVLALEATLPARGIPTDHGGIDDERFPSPGRAQRSLEDGLRIGIRDAGTADSGTPRILIRNVALFDCQGWIRPNASSCEAAQLVSFLSRLERHLRERQILGEPRGRQLFGRARQQRKKRPSGCQRTACAATEPGRHPRAAQGMLDQADVVLRRAHEHRHLVESHAGARLAQDSSGDLDRLSSLARRGEEFERTVQCSFERAAPPD